MKRSKNSIILNIVLILSVLLYLFFAYKNELIPFRFQLIAFAVVIFFFVLGSFIKNKWIKILTIVLIVLLSVVHLKAQDMLGQIFLIDAETSAVKVKKTNLSLISLKEASINLSKDTLYGTSKELDNSSYEFIFNKLAEENNETIKLHSELTNIDLANALYSENIEVMILDETQREKLLEDFPGFNDTTKILRTIEREEILASNAKQVNPIKESFVILMTGNDTWGEISEESRSDVNILAIANPKINQILLFSLPRDTYVELACGNDQMDKLTHAGMYSVDCQIETIENFLDVSINYYAKVNFTSLGSIIHTLDNKLRLYNPFAFQGHTEEYYFEEGCLELDALGTLNYVRTRKELPNGDFDRQENQKRVLKSLIKKITNPSRIFDLAELFNVMSKEVDTNIDVKFVNRLISNQLDKMPDWNIHNSTINGYDDENETYSYPGELLYVFQPYEDSVEEAQKKISEFMNAGSIEAIEFLQPENEDSISETEVVNDPQADTTENEVVSQPAEITEPENEIYYFTVDDTIEKYGHIFEPVPLGLNNDETKEEYIHACEISIGR